jgi:hypothetical protein
VSAFRFVLRWTGRTLEVTAIAIGVGILVAILAVVAILAFVLVRNHLQIEHNQRDGERGSRGYALIHKGDTNARVRRLLGKPTTTYCHCDPHRKLACWEYGGYSDLGDSSTVIVDFCFDHSRLVTKERSWTDGRGD